MGTSPWVGYDRFPEQSLHVGKKCRVAFNYDLKNYLLGTIVRDDLDEPYHGIIQMDNGRFVLATECQYSIGCGWV